MRIKLKHATELRPRELPYIEKPFFARGKLKAQFKCRREYEISGIDRIVRTHISRGRQPFPGYQQYVDPQEKAYLWRRLEEMVLKGDLYLVHLPWIRRYFPAALWYKDARSPFGRWVIDASHNPSFYNRMCFTFTRLTRQAAWDVYEEKQSPSDTLWMHYPGEGRTSPIFEEGSNFHRGSFPHSTDDVDKAFDQELQEEP